MTGMQNIKAAIGHHNTLAMRTGILDGNLQLCGIHFAETCILTVLCGTPQFRHRNARGTQLANDDAGCQICQRRGGG